ncbi:MAG: helix-turn-helix domain-containing protein [Leifsonia sp.]
MSVESLAIALHHSQATGTAKLVLIGIANHDGDGGAWPSVATLARYAGGVDTRNVQRALDKLIRLGEVRKEIQAGGDERVPDHRKPNLYRFLLACPHNCDRTRNHRTRHQELFSDGVADTPPGVASAGGRVASAPPKPSLEPNHIREMPFAHVLKAEVAPCGHKWMTDCIGRYCEFGHSTGDAS